MTCLTNVLNELPELQKNIFIRMQIGEKLMNTEHTEHKDVRKILHGFYRACTE